MTRSPNATDPRVSVIVRNYNRGERLLRACRSVFAQDFEDFELLLVDDASSDGSAERAQQAFGADPRFRLLALPENRNAGGAAAAGVEAARAPLIAFLDSDDEWLPGALSAYVEAAAEEPDRLLFYGDLIFRYEAADIERLHICPEPRDQRGAILKGGVMHTLSSVAVRRDAVLAAGNYEARWTVAHDLHLHMKLALGHERPFRRLRRPVVRYNVLTDNVMQSYETWNREVQEILREGHAHPKAELYRPELSPSLAKNVMQHFARQKNDEAVADPKPRGVTAVVFARAGGAALEASMASLRAQSAPPEETLLIALGPSRPELRSAGPGSWLALDRRLDRRRALMSVAAKARTPLIAVLEEGDQWAPDYLAAQRRANALMADTPVFTFADDDESLEEEIFEISSDIRSCWAANPFPRRYSSMMIPRARLQDLAERRRSSLGDDAAVTGRLLLELCVQGRRYPFRLRRPLLASQALAA